MDKQSQENNPTKTGQAMTQTTDDKTTEQAQEQTCICGLGGRGGLERPGS